MITLAPGATVTWADTGITTDQNPVPFGGQAINCPTGAIAQDVQLAANASDVALPFPIGLSTAAVIGIYAVNVPDLIIKVNGQTLSVPKGQPWFGYNIASSAISVSTVSGGKITCVVGG